MLAVLLTLLAFPGSVLLVNPTGPEWPGSSDAGECLAGNRGGVSSAIVYIILGYCVCTQL